MSDLGTDGRDELDVALTRALRGPAGSDPDSALVLEQMRPRLTRARAGRRLRIAGAVGFVLAGVVVTALAAGPGAAPRTRIVVPAVTGTSPVPTAPPSTSTSTPAAAGPAPSNPVSGGVPTASTPPPTASSTATAPTGTTAPRATPPGPPAAPVTRTYTAPGGQVSIRFADGALTLLSATANPGYSAETDKAGPDDVDIRFRAAAGADSRIRVRVEGAELQVETS